MPQEIITLPKQLANQIAAGEVVERPVSVVKELIENSIDAGATQIEVRLKEGGIKNITVRDNGLGIPGDALLKALEKYSTSKIRSIDDLYKVMTFWFRWEALASISSVSNFTISSKTPDEPHATCVKMQWWENPKKQITAHEVGTTVEVNDLFIHTPARLSYLKKPRTEYLKVQEYIYKIALSYPKIKFSLLHDEKQTVLLIWNQSLPQRIHEIYGAEFYDNMKKVSHDFSGIHVHGYISDPKISFKNTSRQALFVNNRVITSPMISKAIKDAYNRFIPHGSFPGYILFLEIDPTQVDVNVHPRKLEVRFAEESSIFRSVYHGVKDELERVSLVSDVNVSPWVTSVEIDIWQEKKETYYTGSGTKFKNYSPYKNTQANPAQATIEFSQEILGNKEDFKWFERPQDIHETPLGRIVGQVHNSYIIVQTHKGIQMLDQHALAERVIYEKLAKQSYTSRIQQILWGIGLHLTSQELSILEEYSDDFQAMWFEIDILSQWNVMIQWIPDFVKKEDIWKTFWEILWDISQAWSKWLQEIRHKIWAYTACRSAVKFGDPLSIFEIHKLLSDANLDYSATCPHGRPVVYEVSLEELQKKYER